MILFYMKQSGLILKTLKINCVPKYRSEMKKVTIAIT